MLSHIHEIQLYEDKECCASIQKGLRKQRELRGGRRKLLELRAGESKA